MNWQEYKDSPTSELLEYIKWKDDPDPDCSVAAANAYHALYFRFREDLIKKCRIISNNWGYSDEEGNGLAEASFTRFWQYPYSFNEKKCTVPDLDKCLKFYLYTIAKNLLSTLRDQHEGIRSPYDGSEQIIIDFPALENMDFPIEKKKGLQSMYDKINEILNSLSPKHKIIYLTYKQHEKEGFKLPRKLLTQLREELELTQNSIRIYKKEAFESVNQLLKNYGNK